MRRWFRASLTVPALLFAGLVALLLVALGGYRVMAPPAILDAGRDIQFDDFAFTATRAEAADAVGRVHPSRPGRAFYLVDVRVTNHARRVAFVFHGDVVDVFDGQGHGLVWSPAAQTALNEETRTDHMLARVAVGESATRRLAFEGPAGLGELRVGFFFGGIVGSVLDTLLAGRRLIEVPVAR